MSKSVKGFYNQIINLAHIIRYSTVPRIKNESVAEHSFFVSALVIRLHKDYEFDLGRAVTMSTVHDWTESWMDDIMVTTKWMFPKIKAAAEEAEAEIAVREFPQPVYELWYEHKEAFTVESKIVHYADVLQVKQYAENEVAMGNNHMRQVLDRASERIFDLEKQLVRYRRIDEPVEEAQR